MKKNVLVIVDSTDCRWLDSAGRADVGQTHFDMLSLGLNNEVVRQVDLDRYNAVKSLAAVETDSFADPCQTEVRDFVPAFIYRFPREKLGRDASIMDLLRMRSFNMWWFTEMSEKGALRTPLIKRLYFLAMIKEALSRRSYDEVWLELSDPGLAGLLKNNRAKLPVVVDIKGRKPPFTLTQGVRFWKRTLFNIVRELAGQAIRRAMLKISGLIDRTSLPDNTFVFFSYFPFFWIKSSEASYIENFFRSAPGRLAQRMPVRFAVWLTIKGPFNVWRWRREIAEDIKRHDLVLLESYLSFRDIVSSALLAFKYIFRAFKYRFVLRNRLKAEFAGWDISNIVGEELDRSLSSAEMTRSLLLMKAVKRFTDKNKLAALMYRIEFQPHERAIEYGAAGRCLTLALQHQALGRNHLQYFFPKEEITSYYNNDADKLPLPGHFFVAGEYPLSILKQSGFKGETIRLCGPVRYAGLTRYLKERPARGVLRANYGYGNNSKIVLVTPPSTRDEMLPFMFSLLTAARQGLDGVLFLFKFHPVYRFDLETEEMISNFCPQVNYKFLADDINLNDYLSLADALLLTGTTVGIEAICLGTVPVLFENKATFSLNPLLEIRDACFCVSNSETLRRALRTVIKGAPELEKVKNNWPQAIKKIFYRIDRDPDESFISELEKIGAI